MEQNRRKPRRRRVVLAAMVLVLLYVLSSGPLQFSHTVSAAEPWFADEEDARWSEGSSANPLALNLNILGEDGALVARGATRRSSGLRPVGHTLRLVAKGLRRRSSGCPDIPGARGSAIIGACFRFETPDGVAA